MRVGPYNRMRSVGLIPLPCTSARKEVLAQCPELKKAVEWLLR